jgi:Glu-tRNA(Gln) amidotransferase subunit E-like FAD-binding protein
VKEEQEYYHKRKETHKIIRNKKKTYMKNVIESIEDQKHKNTRKMYQTVNQFKKGHQHKYSTIRNKKRELAMNTMEKAEIWKEYFDQLLNTEELRGIKKENKEIDEVEVEELTTEDVIKAIRNLKNNKEPGN